MKLVEIRRDRVGACHGELECIGSAHGPPPSGGVQPPSLQSRKLGGAGKCGSQMGRGANEGGTRFGMKRGSGSIGGQVGP